MSIQKIAKNISVFGIAQIIISMLGFFLLIYIARYLGEVGFGRYSFALSFTSLFLIFGDIGISQFIIRELARNEEYTNEYVTNASVIKFILSFITFVLIVVIINLMDYPQDIKYVVYLFGIYTILTSFGLTFKSIYQAHQKLEYMAVSMVIEQIVLFSLIMWALFSGYGLIELAYAHVITGIINVLLGISIVTMKFAKPKFTINLHLWKKLIIGSIPFALNTLFAIFFFRIDSVMLSILKNDAAVGIYNAAYTPLLALTSMISQIIVSALYPMMAKSYIDSNDSLRKLTISSSTYMAIIGFPIAIGCFVLADRFVSLLYGGKYTSSIVAFQILALYIPIRLVSSITGTLLSSINKQSFRTASVGFSALFNIILNAAMIPSLSYIGASIATILSELVLYFCLIYSINKQYGIIKIHKHFIKPFIASLLMGLFVYYLKTNLFLVILLGALVYLIILILLGTFVQEDKNILNQILNRNEEHKDA